MHVLLWIVAVPVAVGVLVLKWKSQSMAREWGREHQLPPGPARLAPGLGLTVVFVVVGVLMVVLPADPWRPHLESHGWIPLGYLGIMLVISGTWLAVAFVRHRNDTATTARRESA